MPLQQTRKEWMYSYQSMQKQLWQNPTATDEKKGNKQLGEIRANSSFLSLAESAVKGQELTLCLVVKEWIVSSWGWEHGKTVSPFPDNTIILNL